MSKAQDVVHESESVAHFLLDDGDGEELEDGEMLKKSSTMLLLVFSALLFFLGVFVNESESATLSAYYFLELPVFVFPILLPCDFFRTTCLITIA